MSLAETPRVKALIDAVATHVGKRGQGLVTCAALAADIGFEERQVWYWVVKRGGVPNGEATLALLGWLRRIDPDLFAEIISKLPTSGVDARK